MNVRNRALAAVACAAAAIVVAGCSRKTETPPAAASTVAVEMAADTIYVGGDIVTVNDAQPGAEALAIKDGRILAIDAQTGDVVRTLSPGLGELRGLAYRNGDFYTRHNATPLLETMARHPALVPSTNRVMGGPAMPGAGM